MHKYELIVYWSKGDGRFVVEVPELAGCMADGETYDQAVQNAQIIISEWIETANSLVPCLRNLFLDIGNLRYLEVSTE